MAISITKPLFDQSEEKIITEVLRSGWVTQGPKVEKFEELVCKFTGAKYAIATTSATTALFLSLHVLGIGKGDEVIVPSFTFIATPNVVVHTGAKPIFVDIDPDTYNLDPQKIEKLITKKTKAIIAVDQVGLPADLDTIYKIARKHNLHVIEDAACALGSEYKGKKIGSFGKLVCFSFHPRKIITTGEGGMIVTDDKTLANKLRILRHHGMSVSDVSRHNSNKVLKEHYALVGYNFRMSDLQAAVGVAQIGKISWILKQREKLASQYTKLFKRSNYIITPNIPNGYKPNWQSYMIRLKKNKKITRNQLMQKLLTDGISTRIGVKPSHQEKAYKKITGDVKLPVTEQVSKEIITLPLYPQMTNDEQHKIIERILYHIGEHI